MRQPPLRHAVPNPRKGILPFPADPMTSTLRGRQCTESGTRADSNARVTSRARTFVLRRRRSARALITAVLDASDFETDPNVAAVLDEVRLIGDPHSLVLHLIQWAHYAFVEANDIAEANGDDRLEGEELTGEVDTHGNSPVMASRVSDCLKLLELPLELVLEDMTRVIDVLINAYGDRAMVLITTFFAHSLGRAARLLPEDVSPREILSLWFLEADAEE